MNWQCPASREGELGRTCRKSGGFSRTRREVELPPPERNTIDLEGRIVKDGVRKKVKDRQLALDGLVKGKRHTDCTVDGQYSESNRRAWFFE